MTALTAALTVVAGALLAPSAQAQPVGGKDEAPPTVDHAPAAQCIEGEALVIEAVIRDDNPIFAPAVYVRRAETSEYLSIAMAEVSPGRFRARLPAHLVHSRLDYFIEAFDELGNGPARVGSPTRPISVSVVMREEASLPPPGEAPLEEGPSDGSLSIRGSLLDEPPPGEAPLHEFSSGPRLDAERLGGGALSDGELRPPSKARPSASPVRPITPEDDLPRVSGTARDWSSPLAAADPEVTVSADEDDGSVFSKWWFWALVGAAVVGGAAAGTYLALESSSPCDPCTVQVLGPNPAAGL